MNRLSLAWLFSAALALGCGGTVVEGSGHGGSGSSAGHGGSGSGGSAEGGSTSSTTTPTITETFLPPECAVETDLPGPYPVTFQFTTSEYESAFLLEDCHTQFTVTSCADGYTVPIGIRGNCTMDCSEDACIDCGACTWSAVPVTPESPVTEMWDGRIYTFSTNTVGCDCHQTWSAPAGKYRVNVKTYMSMQDAFNDMNGVPVSFDFELPAPKGIVEVPVGILPP